MQSLTDLLYKIAKNTSNRFTFKNYFFCSTNFLFFIQLTGANNREKINCTAQSKHNGGLIQADNIFWFCSKKKKCNGIAINNWKRFQKKKKVSSLISIKKKQHQQLSFFQWSSLTKLSPVTNGLSAQFPSFSPNLASLHWSTKDVRRTN